MKYSSIALLALSAFLFTGCSKMKVRSQKTADYNFGNVQTYEWVQAPKNILDAEDTYLNENVQIALNNQLVGRGWTQVLESDKADIQIVYYIKLKEHQEFAGSPQRDETRVTGGFTYDTNKGSWGYNEQGSDLNVYTIEVGTLSLLIYNAKSGEVIWSGTLETRLDRSTPVEKQKKMLNKIARRIASDIPLK